MQPWRAQETFETSETFETLFAILFALLLYYNNLSPTTTDSMKICLYQGWEIPFLEVHCPEEFILLKDSILRNGT